MTNKTNSSSNKHSSRSTQKPSARRADSNVSSRNGSRDVAASSTSRASNATRPVSDKNRPQASNLKPLGKAERKAAKKAATPRWKRWLKRLVLAVIIAVAAGVLLVIAVFAWFAKDLPSPDQLENRVVAESTKIYDRSGEHLLYETGKDVRRTYTKINDISEYAQQATVALEDKHFYTHHGFDPLGILRSAGINIASEQQVGGSTITQQFVKLAIVGSDKTYSRKIKELILSIEMERKYDKSQILEFYMNEASYGGINVGIAAAAQSYFNKKPSELSLAESALLASVPQRPTYYISQDRDALYARKDFALDRMAEEGYITDEEAEAAKAEDVTLQQTVAYKDAPHFVDYVLSQLEDDFGGGFINQGLRVITTLDYDKQNIAEEVIQDGIAGVEAHGGSNSALVSMDAHTGQVLAMVGSKDYYADNYDGQVNVATSLRQPGSSFKPVAYLTGFANGYTPNTVLFDVRTNFPIETGNYAPNNYSGGFSGPVTIRHAIGQSLNIPAVKMLYLVGLDKTLDTAEALGYSSFYDRSRYGLALVLGGGEVTLLEHTSAYATFAREGMRHPTTTILQVLDQGGSSLYEWSNSETQVVDQAAVQTLNSVLSDSSARSGFGQLNIPGKTIAAKTGTTNDFHDAWAMMYTPSFVTGVWSGNNDNAEMGAGAAGLIISAPIVNAYMTRILEGLPDEGFNAPPPSNANKGVLSGQIGETVEKFVDKETQHIIPDECLGAYPEEYKQKREFKEAHNILHYLRKDDPLGSPPSGTDSDPMYTAWEEGVKEWAKGQEEYVTEETEFEDCNLRSADQTPSVTITLPISNAQLTPETFSISPKFNAGNGRTITKVEYIIDQTTVDVRTSSPFTSSYAPTNLSAGSHTLIIRATNDRGNIDEASVKFSYEPTVTKKDSTIIIPGKGTNSNSNTNSNTNANKNSNTNSNGNKNNKKTNKNSN